MAVRELARGWQPEFCTQFWFQFHFVALGLVLTQRLSWRQDLQAQGESGGAPRLGQGTADGSKPSAGDVTLKEAS